VELCFNLCIYVVGTKKMERVSLLSPDIESKHRAARLEESPGSIEPLVTRTPKVYWMIHHAWVPRYLFIPCMFILFIHSLHVYLCILILCMDQFEVGWAFTFRTTS
jgi:hypothetical protein